MGENKKRRARIATYLQRIAEHEAKINAELAKNVPNERLIAKWRKEIATFELNISKTARRLPGRRKS